MAKINDWEVIGIGGAKTFSSEDEIIVTYEGDLLASVRITPRGVLAVDGKECTFYVKPETKTIEVSFIRSEL